MTEADIYAVIATVLALLLAAALIHIRALRADNGNLSTANRLLGKGKADLRKELTAARYDADTAIVERDAALDAADMLRVELNKNLRWRNELRQAAAEETFLMQPPNRNERPAPRKTDAWASLMNARFQAPAVLPPHEQQQDGDTA
ncbi:hypothetical protein AB0M02_00235 [Actinoplanes sp. NPDC051861]|uniref:hypothetical protein n=1 Tax=Actinoplanes sp. NPDC051861 TaxID=3155170 RepID=UPI00344561F0